MRTRCLVDGALAIAIETIERRAFLVIVREDQRAVEQRIHLHRFVHHLANRTHLTLHDEVAAPEVVGRKPGPFRHHVHVPLEREQALRRAEPPEGAVRRRGCGHRAAADADVGAVVGAGRVERAARQYDR